MSIIINRLPDPMILKEIGIWDKYKEESNHIHSLEEEIDYLNGNVLAWVAVDTESQEIVGFTLATTADHGMEAMLQGFSAYVAPEYRKLKVMEMMWDSMEMCAKIWKIPRIGAPIDDMRLLEWGCKLIQPDQIYLLLVKDIN